MDDIKFERISLNRQVASLAQVLKHIKHTSNGKTLALYHSCSQAFLVRLLAASHAGFDIIFPANGQLDNIHQASELVDCVLVEGYHCSKSITLEKLTSRALDDDEFDYLNLPLSGQLTFFTSGSSGYAKPIVKSWQHIRNEVTALHHTFSFAHEARVVATVSHQHIYGLLFKLLWPLYAHYRCDFTFVEFPEQLAKLVASTPSIIVTSPAFIERLLRDNVLQDAKHNIVGIFSSGGPLSDESAVAMWQQLACGVTQVYGSTETGGIAHRQVTELTVTPWQCFAAVNVTKRGNHFVVHSSYFAEAEFETQDTGELLEDGRFILAGRLDRTIKLEEKRVNLDAIERSLVLHSALNKCRVILLQKGFRKQLGVVAELNDKGLDELDKQGKLAFNKSIKQHLSSCFEPVCIPRKFRYVSELPRNSQGKMVLAELEKLFD